METKKCKSCQTEIDIKAKKCPHCQTDQRSWFMRYKIITGVLVIIIIGIISTLGSQKPEKSTTSPVATTAITETNYKVGETIKTDNFEITVGSVERRKAVGGDIFKSDPSEGGIYVTVEWKYKNISDKPIGSFSTPTIKLIDSSGVSYNADIGASGNFATELKLDRKIISDLNPGITVNDAEVFEVSEESFSENTGWHLLVRANNKEIKISL